MQVREMGACHSSRDGKRLIYSAISREAILFRPGHLPQNLLS